MILEMKPSMLGSANPLLVGGRGEAIGSVDSKPLIGFCTSHMVGGVDSKPFLGLCILHPCRVICSLYLVTDKSTLNHAQR